MNSILKHCLCDKTKTPVLRISKLLSTTAIVLAINIVGVNTVHAVSDVQKSGQANDIADRYLKAIKIQDFNSIWNLNRGYQNQVRSIRKKKS